MENKKRIFRRAPYFYPNNYDDVLFVNFQYADGCSYAVRLDENLWFVVEHYPFDMVPTLLDWNEKQRGKNLEKLISSLKNEMKNLWEDIDDLCEHCEALEERIAYTERLHPDILGVREALASYKNEHRKVSRDIQELLTDRKYLECVLDQIVSKADEPSSPLQIIGLMRR